MREWRTPEGAHVFSAGHHRTRLRIVLAACAAYAMFAALLAASIPREGTTFISSFLWWLIAIPIALTAYAVLEFVGGGILGWRFWQRMPSWARVLLMVVIILAIVSTVLVAAGLLR